jgi:ligand-binding SRPBCC domain-containing protein
MFDALIRWLGTGERPAGAITTLHREAVVPASLNETFAFFSNAVNLERLTPPWINFRIRTPPPIDMREGTVIDYQIVLYGLPVPWRTRIDVWEPGHRFVDRQVAGPYRWWHHEHRFEPEGAGTRVIDHVEYVPRAAIISSRLVARDVQRIFAFRQRALARLLDQSTKVPPIFPPF